MHNEEDNSNMTLTALILSLGIYLVAEGEYGLEPILGVLTILSITLAQITSILGMSRSHSVAVLNWISPLFLLHGLEELYGKPFHQVTNLSSSANF